MTAVKGNENKNMKRRDPKMSLKKIQTENQNETKEIFKKNEREKWDFIICI